jgi:hypothetical protein
MINRLKRGGWWVVYLAVLLVACAPSPTPAVTQTIEVTRAAAATVTAFTPTATQPTHLTHVYIESSVPDKLRSSLSLPEGMVLDEQAGSADATLGTLPAILASSKWIYALVAPFPDLVDEVSANDLISAWRNDSSPTFLNGQSILVSKDTRAAFKALWGEPGKNIKTVNSRDLLYQAWAEHYAFAIIPFEEIEPRWKIIHLDGQSPLEKHFDDSQYPLVVNFGWKQTNETAAGLSSAVMIKTNRDIHKMTVITMTGTTALVRALGAQMEAKGMTYPAQGGTVNWFWDADYVHISNEVSFSDTCPPGNANQKSLQFCSRPEYLQLLQYIHANIIELTGNHILDWDLPAFEHTLKLYHDNHMMVYAGGKNLDEARSPLKIEHNGNKIAFLGCNPAGPEMVWALPDRAGGASCDYALMKSQIKMLRRDGYLPIVTLQYSEGYGLQPSPQQKIDFDALSDAGAVIVSGSQAHSPQIMTFRGDRLVHYGPGNTFFDMMHNPYDLGTKFDLGGKTPVAGVRLGVVDRHIFYEGQYINTELFTDELENFSQLRPLTDDERQRFLTLLFKAAGW